MMDIWLVNIAGVLVMVAIVGWFWLWPRRHTVAAAGQVIHITVANGVYEPDSIAIRRGETATLNFHRVDPSPCAEQVIFHDLDISASLPIGGTRAIHIVPRRAGTFRFTCQMQMYQGTLKVLD
jgi:plastocyanin domain-containing protein